MEGLRKNLERVHRAGIWLLRVVILAAVEAKIGVLWPWARILLSLPNRLSLRPRLDVVPWLLPIFPTQCLSTIPGGPI